MTCVLAVFTLHPGGILEEVSAKSAAHNVVELLKQKFMAIQFVDLFLALTNGTLPTQANIKRPTVFALFCWRRKLLILKQEK